jgi:hypothetical protein
MHATILALRAHIDPHNVVIHLRRPRDRHKDKKLHLLGGKIEVEQFSS